MKWRLVLVEHIMENAFWALVGSVMLRCHVGGGAAALRALGPRWTIT